VAFHPDGLRLASGGEDRKARVWSVGAGGPPPTDICDGDGGLRSAVNGVAWSPDGRLLATLGSLGPARLWDVAAGAAIHTLRGDLSNRFSPTRPAFSPDGRLLAVPRGEGVTLLGRGGAGPADSEWRVAAELAGHAGRVTAVAFSPDGALLATASEDGTARVWAMGLAPAEPPPESPAVRRRLGAGERRDLICDLWSRVW
jgi:WD40 repeat protein